MATADQPNPPDAGEAGPRTVESVKAEVRELSGLDPVFYGGEWMLAKPGDFMALCRRDRALGDIVGELLCWLDEYAEPANG